MMFDEDSPTKVELDESTPYMAVACRSALQLGLSSYPVCFLLVSPIKQNHLHKLESTA